MPNNMEADTGGRTDSTQILSINDVKYATGKASGDTVESLKGILYALPISSDETLDFGRNAKTSIEENKEDIESVFGAYFNTLEATNSKRMNTSEAATESGNNLHQVSSDMDALQQAINDYMAENIAGEIENYNTKLTELKRGAKLKLLRMKADEINDAAKAGTSSYYYYDRKDQWYEGEDSYPNDREIDKNTWRRYNSRETYTVDYYPTTNATRSTTPQQKTKYRGTYTDYKYINYWGVVNSTYKWYDFWPFNAKDDDVYELAQRFKSLDIELPYDESSIIEVGVHNSSSGAHHGGSSGSF